MTAAPSATLHALAKDVPALIGLGILIGALWYLTREIRALRNVVEPVVNSPIVRTAIGIR